MAGCLVLNASFQPLGAITEEEAIAKVVEGLGWIYEEDTNKPYRSQYTTIYAPRIIVLNYYVRPKSLQIKPEKLTNRALFRRDGYVCQYCGRHKKDLGGHEKLTADHVIPESQGGRYEWLNVVTACSTCNHRKADQSLEKSGMSISHAVRVPVTWTIRGKALLSRAQVRYVEEELLKIRTQYLTEDEVEPYLSPKT